MSHQNCSLYLHPQASVFSITELTSLITRLSDIELISQPIKNRPDDKNSFYVGNKYLAYITYMGCSPAIKFEEDENSAQFCHIKIHQYDTAKLIVNQTQKRAPHCPRCHQAVTKWQDSKTDTTIRCDHCKTTSSIEDFDWRKMAGTARLFIEVTDIFPKEAIPQPALLEKLAELTDTKWTYFYSCG
jgi:DNA-directed RNA polymerase subunit RPC12/RpoP